MWREVWTWWGGGGFLFWVGFLDGFVTLVGLADFFVGWFCWLVLLFFLCLLLVGASFLGGGAGGVNEFD